MSVNLLSFILIAYISTVPLAKAPSSQEIWAAFKTNHLTYDGRIIDKQNNDISHSEGQGYGLFLAQHFNEKDTFKLLLGWSENNLGSGLKAWKWGRNGKAWDIIDHNNATDGDILHAWALLLAGEKWNDNTYTKKGLELLKRIKDCCVTEEGLILPGQAGFIQAEGIIINPSYYIFPALHDFKRFDSANEAFWEKTINKGLYLLTKGGSSETGLPPDWLLLTPGNQIIPYPRKQAVFGYEAIRIPLYLTGNEENELWRPFKKFIPTIIAQGYLPACVPLAEKPGCPEKAAYGNYAVMSRVARKLNMAAESDWLKNMAIEKSRDEDKYYDTILLLLSDIL